MALGLSSGCDFPLGGGAFFGGGGGGGGFDNTTSGATTGGPFVVFKKLNIYAGKAASFKRSFFALVSSASIKDSGTSWPILSRSLITVIIGLDSAPLTP